MKTNRIHSQDLPILLNTPEEIQRFVGVISTLDSDFELISGECTLDARSILGLFSIDWSTPATLRIYAPSQGIVDAVMPFISKR